MVARGYKDTEIGVIPVEWDVVKLEKIVKDTHQGINTVTDKIVYTDEGIDILQAKHITSEVIDFSDPRKVSIETYNKYKNKYQAKINDLLLTNIGTIGKVVKVEKDIPFLIAWNIFLIKLNPELCSSEFILNFFRNLDRLNYYDKHLTGNATKFINKKIMNEIKIPLPPLKEQEKIADILFTADAKIDAIASQIQKAQTVKKGLLQKLLSEGIGHSEFKDSELGKIPKSWEVVKFKDITKVRQGLQIPISKRKTEPCENCYQYITIQFVKNNKEIEYIKNPQQSVICAEDDVLMTRTGNTGIVITDVNGVFHNNFFLIDFDRTKISKDFLVYYLKSHNIQKEILLKAGATTIPDLNHGDFYSIKFLYPPLKEQKQIAEILSTADAKIEVLMSKKEMYETLKKGLLQKLLSGEVRV